MRVTPLVIVGAVLGLAGAMSLSAAETEQVVNAVAEKTTSGAYVMQLLFSLLVVLGAIGGLAWIIKRINRLPGRGAGQMRILGAMSLGTRERAVLVQVGDKQMLLGVAPGRVSTLHIFDEQVVDVKEVQSGALTGNSFASILGNLNRDHDRGSRS